MYIKKILHWQGTERPPLYTVRINASQPELSIYVDQTETESVWTAVRLVFPLGVTDYDSIVAALVEYRYPADKMQSVINNYLEENNITSLFESLTTFGTFLTFRNRIREWLDSLNSNALAEYLAMQQWRNEAKRIARQIVGELGGDSGESEENNSGDSGGSGSIFDKIFNRN